VASFLRSFARIAGIRGVAVLSFATLAAPIATFLASSNVGLAAASVFAVLFIAAAWTAYSYWSELRVLRDSLKFQFWMSGLTGGPGLGRREGASTPEPGYDLWLVFENGSQSHSIEYRLESVAITLGGHAAQDATLHSAGGIIPAKGNRLFRHPWIAAPIDPPLTGRGEYVALFGFPGTIPQFRCRHEFEITWSETKPLFVTIGDILYEELAP
jgi:hypothetical protein